MKRLLSVILILLTLTGCGRLTPDSYLSVKPHKEQMAMNTDANAVTAEDYDQLRDAILGFVENGQTMGVIRVNTYDGDVEADLAEAAYEVSKQDPVGAFAVDYMTHECVRVVSYYEIRIFTTFRRTREDLERVELMKSTIQLQERVEQALENCETELLLRMNAYWEQDVVAMAEQYAAEHPESVMERPRITVTTYPQSGPARILEIALAYTQSPEELQAKKKAVQESLDGAAEYIRYRQTELDKVHLLYTYLTSRFSYVPGKTATPLYAALCEGIADPAGLAQAWQLICRKAGVDCKTVTGAKNGEVYHWNIISADGVYRHLDLSDSILERGRLVLMTDGDMTEYYWETRDYPACQ